MAEEREGCMAISGPGTTAEGWSMYLNRRKADGNERGKGYGTKNRTTQLGAGGGMSEAGIVGGGGLDQKLTRKINEGRRLRDPSFSKAATKTRRDGMAFTAQTLPNTVHSSVKEEKCPRAGFGKRVPQNQRDILDREESWENWGIPNEELLALYKHKQEQLEGKRKAQS